MCGFLPCPMSSTVNDELKLLKEAGRYTESLVQQLYQPSIATYVDGSKGGCRKIIQLQTNYLKHFSSLLAACFVLFYKTRALFLYHEQKLILIIFNKVMLWKQNSVKTEREYNLGF